MNEKCGMTKTANGVKHISTPAPTVWRGTTRGRSRLDLSANGPGVVHGNWRAHPLVFTPFLFTILDIKINVLTLTDIIWSIFIKNYLSQRKNDSLIILKEDDICEDNHFFEFSPFKKKNILKLKTHLFMSFKLLLMVKTSRGLALHAKVVSSCTTPD